MRWIALAALLASTPVEAHCYSRWYYPFPQRCAVARQMVRAERGHNPTKFREVLSLDIPLPSLARADLDGGEADEPTRAKILLRAALEAPNGL